MGSWARASMAGPEFWTSSYSLGEPLTGLVGWGGPACRYLLPTCSMYLEEMGQAVLFSVGTSGGMKGYLGSMHGDFLEGTSMTVPHIMDWVSRLQISMWLLQPHLE